MAEPPSEEVANAVQALYRYGATLLRAGVAPAEVEDALVAKGVERSTAVVIVRKLTAARDEVQPPFDPEERDHGQRDMLIGGVLVVGGLAVSLGSYAVAEDGGRYMVFWGAVIFGAIRFFRGLSRSSGS